MTRNQLMTIFNSFSLEDKLLIAKQIQTQMAKAEERADVAAYKKAKRKPGKFVPFNEAFHEIEAYHDKHA